MTTPSLPDQRDRAPDAAASLGAAVEENSIAYWRACAPRMPGGAFHDDVDLTWFRTDVASAPWLNQVLRTRFAEPDAGARIDEVVATFAERRVPMLWAVSPSDQPADLEARLQRRGLERGGGVLTGMAMDLSMLPAATPVAGLTIERARDVAGLERWMQAYVDGFGMAEDQARPMFDLYRRVAFDDASPFRHYVATLSGRPVASSTVFLGAGYASIWHVATLPAVRKRGIGTAVTIAPLLEARDLGIEIGVLASSEAGLSVYNKIGFQAFGETVQYRWSPAS